MTVSPAQDPDDEGGDAAADIDDVVDIDGDDEPPAPPPPYEFDPADVEPATRRLDTAYATARTGHWSDVVDGVRGGPPTAQTLQSETPLDRALLTPVLFQLRLAHAGEAPGCQLGPQVDTKDYAYPSRVRDAPDAEVTLWRELALRAEHPATRARLHDLLAERRDGDVRAHAESAVDAYLELASDAGQAEGGVRLRATEELVRAWEVCRRYQLWDRLPRVQTALLTAASQELATGQHTPGIVLPMLEAAAAPPSRRQPLSATDTPAGTPDLDALIELAINAYPRDYLLAQTMDLARRRASSDDERAALDQRQGELLLTWARDAAGPLRQHRLQVAIAFTRDRGLADIADEATRELQRIRPDELGLQPVRASTWLPRDARERYLTGFTRSPMWAEALALFLNSDCPTGAYDALVQQERDMARVSVLRRLFRRTELTHEGRPAWSTTSDEQDQAAEIAWIASNHAREHGRLLAEGLRRMAERYDVPEERALTEHLSHGGRADVRLCRSLARALILFWRGEYEASVHLIAPKIEAAARALLLELDEPIYRIQVGSDPGGYGGLHGLLTSLEDAGMDPDWIYFLRWLLLGSPGANVRNDLTHGLVFDPGPLHTVLVLRGAALIIPLVAPDAGAVPDVDRDRVLERIRRPVHEPVSWPTAAGISQRLLVGVAGAVRAVADALAKAADAIAP